MMMNIFFLALVSSPVVCLAFVFPSASYSSNHHSTRRRTFADVTPSNTFLSSFNKHISPTTTTAICSTTDEEAAEASSPSPEDGSTGEETLSTEQDATEDDEDSEDKRILRIRHTAFLGNLPFDMTEAEIAELCSPYGTVGLVSIPKNRESGLPRGFAFVDMDSVEELKAVVDNVDGQPFRGRLLRASISEKGGGSNRQEKKPDAEGTAKIYVGNLPFDTDRDELLEFFKQYVDPVEAYIPINSERGTGRGFGFVTLKSEDLETAIAQTNGLEYQGRPLVVNEPLPPGQRSPRRKMKEIQQRDTIKLYVGNLAFTTDVGILEEVFAEFGEVVDCYMPKDPERGGSRGFGFITMDRTNGIEAIAELDGCELDGRIIRVNEALQKPKRTSPRDDDVDDFDIDGNSDE